MSEQRLGILGGMGPQATQDFYQRILDRTDAACDQEHLPTLSHRLGAPAVVLMGLVDHH